MSRRKRPETATDILFNAVAGTFAAILSLFVLAFVANIHPLFESLLAAPVAIGCCILFLHLFEITKGTSMKSEEEKPVSVFESEEWFGVFTNIDDGIPLLIAPSVSTVRHLYLQQHAKEEGVTLEQAEDSIRGLEASGYIFFAPVSVTVRFQKP